MKILLSFFDSCISRISFAVLLLILGTSFSLNSSSQIVTIPDSEFVIFLQANYPACISGDQLDTQCFGIVNATSLILPASITDLYGLEFFVSLTSLEVYGAVTNLPALPNSISTMWLYNYTQSALPPLPSSLTYFVLAYSPIINLPLLPASLTGMQIEECPALTTIPDLPPNFISLFVNHSPSFSTLPALPDSLTYLFCTNTNLSQLPELPAGLLYMSLINNPNLICLPALPDGLIGESDFVSILNVAGTQITCVPNLPSTGCVGTLPICDDGDVINNPNGCEAVNGIHGYVYQESTSNCTYENGTDSPVTNAKLHLVDQTGDTLSSAFTTSNGSYHFFNITDGQYIVVLDTVGMPYIPVCTYPGIDSIVINIGNNDIADVNFNVTCTALASEDATIQGVWSTGIIFPGVNHTLTISAVDMAAFYNLNCLSGYSGELKLTISGPVTYVGPASGALTPTSISGNIYTYTIADFSLLSADDFKLIFNTNTTALAGDFICIDAIIISDIVDSNPDNNSFQFCYSVANSYDPNVKQVYPENVLPEYSDWLTYTIHFQNTGSAPAMNIKLRDTLSNLLETNSFQLLGSSHAVGTQILNDVIIFKFDNINLPDSTSDPVGSIGYVQFRIKPLPNLPDGTEIENEVSIFFDFNAPILTNTATTSYVDDLYLTEYRSDNLFVVYPNPAEDMINFILPIEKLFETISIQIYSAAGEKIIDTIRLNQQVNQISLQDLKEGVYILKVSTSDTNYIQRMVVGN